MAQLAEIYEQEGRQGGDLAAEALRAASGSPYRRCRSEADPGASLDRARQASDAHPISKQVLACRSLLDWTCWSGEGLNEQVSAQLYTTELAGPDGHFQMDGVRVGLLLSEPHTDYPLSSHSGEETYFVISGVAEWIVGDAPYAPKQPGEFVHHPAWTPHGRRTLDEPFLGAWRWSGDLDLGSFNLTETV